ncbi:MULTISPECIES: arginyltransferase [unclassified Vibrio]|uniref:Aspartate/glutamate leucyltransferase n=1 Tax=Vibrio sp. HB236076 TaxID=3232307 RepID=A0AB39HJU9_9VIBR|nr:arginyltransferase [Vibrio sp. HB161653]MDP5255068.1 arginyltransferase [Vibrio sp. HB161653]
MNEPQPLQIGLTQQHTCSYLSDRQERVAVAMSPEFHNESGYQVLLANGFRRSGDTIYTPHCDACSACQSIRIPIADFQPSRSQKRLLNQSHQITMVMKTKLDDGWFELYSRYIEARHRGGTMYPPNRETFQTFANCQWMQTHYLHLYQKNQLIAVAVTDVTPTAASAFYTFFDPDSVLSLGTLAVLQQVKWCQQMNKDWLYLGYQIDECPAMSYKVRFHRHQRLVNQRWQG